jgi:hypothetical protein
MIARFARVCGIRPELGWGVRPHPSAVAFSRIGTDPIPLYMYSNDVDSPERVVLAGFPEGAVRIVASREAVDVVHVLLDMRPNGLA